MNNDFKGDTAARARRRLIRGAFAAPAALTLFSGSVYAQASSARCLANTLGPDGEGGVDAPSSPDGTWLRVQLYKLTPTSSTGNSANKWSTWVSGSDVGYLAALNTPAPYLDSNQYQAVAVGTASNFTKEQIFTGADHPTQGGTTWGPLNGQYVAVRVDGDGKIIGVQDVQTGGSAVSLQCWDSFAANG